MSIFYINAIETVSNLNNSTVTVPDISGNINTFSYTYTDGTYALINQIISDLCMIKNEIKAEETKINTDLLTESKQIDNSTTTPQGFLHTRTVTANQMSASERSVHASDGCDTQDLMFGDGTTNAGTRYTMAGSTANTFPAVFKKNGNGYNEAAVWNILNEAAIIVAGLKLGKWDSSTQITRTATTGTGTVLI